MKKERKWFADWLIELANCGFGMSTDKNHTIFKTAARVPHHTQVIFYVLFHDARLYFWNRLQEKLISRLPVEIYVQLRCYCCVRILGNIGGLQKY